MSKGFLFNDLADWQPLQQYIAGANRDKPLIYNNKSGSRATFLENVACTVSSVLQCFAIFCNVFCPNFAGFVRLITIYLPLDAKTCRL
ncbi:MAG TPA: hypothetical protein VNO70_04470 [Blastocatellia bacterium]|nr:hypothetical protein [Blastocatellia bacterium]